MAIEITIFMLISMIGLLFGIIGLAMDRKYGVFALIGGMIVLALAAQLGADSEIIVGYNASTAITYAVTGEQIILVAIAGVVIMIFGGLRAGRLM